jgi:toxin YoeB
MSCNILFTSHAWEDYLYWQKTDKKLTKKINELLKVVSRTPFEGIGKPEPLKGNLQGFWSRRIDQEHRLVYRYEEETISVISCRYHYD